MPATNNMTRNRRALNKIQVENKLLFLLAWWCKCGHGHLLVMLLLVLTIQAPVDTFLFHSLAFFFVLWEAFTGFLQSHTHMLAFLLFNTDIYYTILHPQNSRLFENHTFVTLEHQKKLDSIRSRNERWKRKFSTIFFRKPLKLQFVYFRFFFVEKYLLLLLQFYLKIL